MAVLLAVFSCVVYKISQQPLNQSLLMSQWATEDVNTHFQLKDESLSACGFSETPTDPSEKSYKQSIYTK